MGFNVGITATFIDKTSRGLQKTTKNVDKLGKTAQRTAGKLKGLRLALGLIAVGTLVNLTKKLVTTIGKLQLLFIRLATVEGGAKQAKVTLDKLFKTFASSPFSIDAVTDSFVRLRSAGIESEQAFRAIQFGADAIAAFGGTSEELKRFSIGLQQVAGKGVVSMEELRQQIGEALPVAMRTFAIESNQSISAVIDKVSKGEISAEKFIRVLTDGLEKDFGGFAKNLGNTILGSLQQAQSRIQKAFLDIFVGDTDVAIRLTALFQAIGNEIENFIRSITQEDVDAFFNSLAAGIRIAAGVAHAIAFLAGILVKFATFLGNLAGQGGATVATLGIIGGMLFGRAGTVAGIVLGLNLISGKVKEAFPPGQEAEILSRGEQAQKRFEEEDDFGGSSAKVIAARQKNTKATEEGNFAQGFANRLLKEANNLMPAVKAGVEKLTESKKNQREAIEGLNQTSRKGREQLGKLALSTDAALKGASSFPFVKSAETKLNRLNDIMKKFKGDRDALTRLTGDSRRDEERTSKEINQIKALTEELGEVDTEARQVRETIKSIRFEGFKKVLGKSVKDTRNILFNFKKLVGGVSDVEMKQREVNQSYDVAIQKLKEQLDVERALVLEGEKDLSRVRALEAAILKSESARQKALSTTKQQAIVDQQILNSNLKVLGIQQEKQIMDLKRSTRGAVETLAASGLGDAAESRKAELSEQIAQTEGRILVLKSKIFATDTSPAVKENLRGQIALLEKLQKHQETALANTSAAAMAAQNLWASVRDTMVSAAEQGLKGLIDGTKTFKEITTDAFNSITQAAIKYLIELIRIRIQTALINSLGNGSDGGGGSGDFFAGAASFIGNMFASKNGNAVTKFGNGGIADQIGSVVKGPSMFGLAGEAGPEGILPLANVGGKLGVNTTGSGGDMHVHITAIDTQSGMQFLMKNKGMITNMFRSEGQLNQAVGKSR